MKHLLRFLLLASLLAGSACNDGLKPASPTFTPEGIPPVAAVATAGEAVSTVEDPPGIAGERTIGDPYIPELGNTGYDVQHYTLRFTIDPDQRLVYGQTTIEARSTLDNLGQVSLDFIGFDITRLEVDGSPGSFARQGNKLIVNLPEPRDTGQPFFIDVTYSGTPPNDSSPYVPFVSHLGFIYHIYQPNDHKMFAVAEPDGARMWYPCNDHPRDKATFTFVLTVPEDMQGVANGILTDTQTEIPNAFPDGQAGDRTTWEMEQPMATYLATAVAGRFTRLDDATPGGVKLRSYVSPDQAGTFPQKTALYGDALDWFAERLGPYPFDEFGYVMIGNTGFSLETQTMVLESSSMPDEVLVHELSHMWFGDWVSLDSWADIWRNEGFATYMTSLYFAKGDMAKMDQTALRWKNYLSQMQLDYPLDNPPPQDMFGELSYSGGALLVYDLHKTMGDEAFFAGLRSYFQKYGGGVASQEQFIAEMEQAHGNTLDEVFQKWFEPDKVK